jgi:hypothetical protein
MPAEKRRVLFACPACAQDHASDAIHTRYGSSARTKHDETLFAMSSLSQQSAQLGADAASSLALGDEPRGRVAVCDLAGSELLYTGTRGDTIAC